MSGAGISLWCFMHDSTIHRLAYDPDGPEVEIEMKLGYPRIEESAFRTLSCHMTAQLTAERLNPEEQPGTDDIGLLISQCSADGFEIFDGKLTAEHGEFTLEVEGYTIDSSDYLRLMLRGSKPLWYHERHQVDLDFLIAMGQRQWDLWQAKAGPELD